MKRSFSHPCSSYVMGQTSKIFALCEKLFWSHPLEDLEGPKPVNGPSNQYHLRAPDINHLHQ